MTSTSMSAMSQATRPFPTPCVRSYLNNAQAQRFRQHGTPKSTQVHQKIVLSVLFQTVFMMAATTRKSLTGKRYVKRTPLKRKTPLKAKTGLKRKTPLKTKRTSRLRIRIDPLDTLFSEYVRKKSGGYCQRCLTYRGWRNLQCCHFDGRSNKAVRWDEENCIAGCMGCHSYLDAHPLYKIAFWQQLLGQDRFDMLNSRARITWPKPDKKAIALYLQEQIKRLDGGEP